MPLGQKRNGFLTFKSFKGVKWSAEFLTQNFSISSISIILSSNEEKFLTPLIYFPKIWVTSDPAHLNIFQLRIKLKEMSLCLRSSASNVFFSVCLSPAVVLYAWIFMITVVLCEFVYQGTVLKLVSSKVTDFIFFIIILELPHLPPTLWTEFTKYDPGDILRANCSTQPSKPSATITFLLNQYTVSCSPFFFNVHLPTSKQLVLLMKSSRHKGLFD